jgi:hypothetical protein
MGGQGGCSSLDAFSRTRVLTPSSESSLNLNDALSRDSRKRKRDATTLEDLLDEFFVFKVRIQKRLGSV